MPVSRFHSGPEKLSGSWAWSPASQMTRKVVPEYFWAALTAISAADCAWPAVVHAKPTSVIASIRMKDRIVRLIVLGSLLDCRVVQRRHRVRAQLHLETAVSVVHLLPPLTAERVGLAGGPLHRRLVEDPERHRRPQAGDGKPLRLGDETGDEEPGPPVLPHGDRLGPERIARPGRNHRAPREGAHVGQHVVDREHASESGGELVGQGRA